MDLDPEEFLYWLAHREDYAEAEEPESREDFVHKMKLAMKELAEARCWLRIIGESGYLPPERLAPLVEESRELSRLAVNLIRVNGPAFLYENSDESCWKILLASNYAGRAINITATTAAHAMSYKLT